MSPEVCQNERYGLKSDIWAMGCILYEMCALSYPFNASNLLGLVYQIVQQEPAAVPDEYSPGLRQLVGQLLSKDPDGRPDAPAILRYPLLQQRLWGEAAPRRGLFHACDCTHTRCTRISVLAHRHARDAWRACGQPQLPREAAAGSKVRHPRLTTPSHRQLTSPPLPVPHVPLSLPLPAGSALLSTSTRRGWRRRAGSPHRSER